MMPIFNLAVAGAGLIGRRHIDLVAANPQTRLSAVIDPTPAAIELAASLNVPHFKSLDDMFVQQHALQIAGIILATPNNLHVSGALTCARHGVSALIEKPVADAWGNGRQLLDELEACEVPMLVGHHRRHSSTLKAARQSIVSGQLGRIVTVMGSAQYYKPDSYFVQGPWRSKLGGGPILINLIHELDNLRFLCGEIESVHATASNAVRQFAVEDTVVMTVAFASGALGTFTMSDTVAAPRSWEQTSGENKSYPYSPTEDCYFIAGTKGSLAVPTMRSWRYADRTYEQDAEHGWWTPFVESRLPVDNIDPLAAQLHHFCEVIAGKVQPIVTVADALQSLLVVDAVQKSIKLGQTIFLRDLSS